MIVLRILEGVGEGTTYPAVNTLLAAWIPRNERAMASAFVYGGAQVKFGSILDILVISIFSIRSET